MGLSSVTCTLTPWQHLDRLGSHPRRGSNHGQHISMPLTGTPRGSHEGLISHCSRTESPCYVRLSMQWPIPVTVTSSSQSCGERRNGLAEGNGKAFEVRSASQSQVASLQPSAPPQCVLPLTQRRKVLGTRCGAI